MNAIREDTPSLKGLSDRTRTLDTDRKTAEDRPVSFLIEFLLSGQEYQQLKEGMNDSDCTDVACAYAAPINSLTTELPDNHPQSLGSVSLDLFERMLTTYAPDSNE